MIRRRRVEVRSLDELETVGEQLGRSSLSLVEVVRHRPSGELLALKSLLRCSASAKHVLNEKRMLQRIDHALIVQLFGTLKDETKLYFVLELVASGHLGCHIRACGSLPLPSVRFYAAELILALRYLHGIGIVHRDIKPGNIVLRNNGHICLIDLGLASSSDSAQVPYSDLGHRQSMVGTPLYWAPELVRGDPYDQSVDVWALGVVIFEMLFGSAPFDARSETSMKQRICGDDLEFPESADASTRELLTGLLRKDSTARWSLVDAEQSRFFAGIDFSHLLEQRAPEVPVRGLGCLAASLSDNESDVDDNTFADF